MTSFRQPGTVLTDHLFAVPLNHDEPDSGQIEIFAREVVAADKSGERLPWLLFLQGGPGFGSPRPVGPDSWLRRALTDYRVLLLDQRGTGRSTPANRRTLAGLGGAAEQADYLALFRADAIVRDCETIRRALLGDEQWSVLGQSFGGFCTTTYLSLAPEGVREAFITGGLPGLDADACDVYRATYAHVVTKNAGHYARYPGDVELVRRIAEHLRDGDVRLPTGRRLTLEAFQTLGIMLGSSTGSHELHYLVEDAFADGNGLSDKFLAQVENRLSFAGQPLYAALHEACYAQGKGATRWAAHRIREEFPQFDGAVALAEDDPVLFTGEMIYPWMFEADPALTPVRDAAMLLAERTDWPELYDAAQLAANEVPAAAAVYYEDMYVDCALSMQTARAIRGLRAWVTNEYEHDGLRVSEGAVLDRLIGMVRGTI